MCDYTICGCTGCRFQTAYAPANWSGNVSGATTDTYHNELTVSGVANPLRKATGEAWQLDFELLGGRATITHEGTEYVFDASNQIISINNEVLRVGRVGDVVESVASGVRLYGGLPRLYSCQLRVTPTHIYIYANGNYVVPGPVALNFTHGVLVRERDGSKPDTAYSAVWDAATVKGFESRSSQVNLDDAGNVTLDCRVYPRLSAQIQSFSGTPPRAHKMHAYEILRRLSKGHLYLGQFPFDLYPPDLTITGMDVSHLLPLTNASGQSRLSDVYIGNLTPYGSFWPPESADWDQYKSSGRAVTSYTDKLFRGDYCAVYDGFGLPFAQTASLPGVVGSPTSYSHTAEASMELDLGESPSVDDKYPLPSYTLTMRMDHLRGYYTCAGEPPQAFTFANDARSVVLPVNSIRDPLSLSLSADQNFFGCSPLAADYEIPTQGLTFTV